MAVHFGGRGRGHTVRIQAPAAAPTPSAPVNTVAPAITGIQTQGQTLTSSNGSWSGYPAPTYAYQWKRAGSNIASATAATYVLVLADVGQAITCTVTATNGTGSASATSSSVTPAATLTLTGTPSSTAPTGVAYTFTPTRAGGHATYTFALTGTLPTGLGFSTSTGAITGTPTVDGTTSGLNITVTDGDGLTAALGTFSITVSGAPVLQANAVPFGDMTGTYNNAGSVDLWALLGVSKPATGTMEWSVTADPTGGASTNTGYFDFTAPAAAADIAGTGIGRTPGISGSGEGARLGTSNGSITGIYFRWKCKLRMVVSGTPGAWSNEVILQYDIRPGAATVGNNYVSDNYAQFGLLGNRTPAAWYTAAVLNGRTPALELAVGINRTSGYFYMGSGFSFTGPQHVVVKYADPARPTTMVGIGFGGSGSTYIEINGITFHGFNLGGFMGNVQLAVDHYRVVNCTFIDLETEFEGWGGTYNGWSAINTTSGSANGVIDGCTFRHKCIPLAAEGSTLEVKNCWFDHTHRVPFSIGRSANGLNAHNNLCTNPHLTVYPSMDLNPLTRPHTDWFQLQDTDGTSVSQNITIKNNCFLMGNANSSNRGFAGGGSNTPDGSGGFLPGTNKSLNLQIVANIWTSWGVDAIEAHSFDGTCSISQNFISLQLCSYATDYPASTIDAGKDRYGPVGPRFTIAPDNAANVGASATMLVQDNFSESTYSANANATPKITATGNQFGTISGGTTRVPDWSGFTETNPRTKLEAISAAVVDPSVYGSAPNAIAGGSEYLAILAYAMNAVRRGDGRGPVNAAGTAFN